MNDTLLKLLYVQNSKGAILQINIGCAEMEEKFYSIGEIAKLSNLSIQTLRYYDQIDLFKPSYIDPGTNYRYYNESQLFHLDLIKSLKYLGTPLTTIKQVQNFTLDKMIEFLAEQEQVIESQIDRLQEVKYTLLKTKKQMEEQLSITTFNEVYETIEETSRLLNIKVKNTRPDYIPNSYYSSLIKIVENVGSIITNRYGSTFTFKDYDSIKDISYNSIFTPLLTDRYIQDLTEEMDVITTVAGRYACISFEYSLDTYLEQYKKLYTYIESQQLIIESDVFEYFMPTSFAPNKEEQFVVELKVKIKDY